MSEFDAIVALGAGAVLLLGVVSGYIRNRVWLSEPVICLAVDVALSPLEFELTRPDAGLGRVSDPRAAGRPRDTRDLGDGRGAAPASRLRRASRA
jgi:hypothetical protein